MKECKCLQEPTRQILEKPQVSAADTFRSPILLHVHVASRAATQLALRHEHVHQI